MESFIFFNQRLTEKLNRIYKYPLTIVSGGAGVGKTFSLRNYLGTTGAETIWHVIKEKSFPLYVQEFANNLMTWETGVEETIFQLDDTISPSDLAVRIATALRASQLSGRKVYILEYMGEGMSNEIMEFLFYLSGQCINSLHIILSLRDTESYREKELLDTNINYISEDCFLLELKEIRSAFKKNGILLGCEEMEYIFLCSNGWLPVIKAIYDEMKQNGKGSAYEKAPLIAEDVFKRSGRKMQNPPVGEVSLEVDEFIERGLSSTGQLIGKYDIVGAYIALEQVRTADRNQEKLDYCIYYNAILLALEGYAAKAVEELEREFDRRIQKGLWESATRILLAGLQLRIFLGGKWFTEEEEMIYFFAKLRASTGTGISMRAAGMALLLSGEYYKLLALFTPDECQREDMLTGCYREYLLAAAYRELGKQKEMQGHLASARQYIMETKCILPALQFFSFFQGKDTRDMKEYDIAPVFSSKDFRETMKLYRKAEKKNMDGHFQDSQKSLTVREAEIVEYVGKGMTNKEIAAQLNISENTVKASLKTVYRKLGITSRKELI